MPRTGLVKKIFDDPELKAAQRDDIRGGVGTTGYCMGGNASFRSATIFGERINATASFHGGFIAASTPDSPHLRAEAIKSRVYIGGAINDGSFTDEALETFFSSTLRR